MKKTTTSNVVSGTVLVWIFLAIFSCGSGDSAKSYFNEIVKSGIARSANLSAYMNALNDHKAEEDLRQICQKMSSDASAQIQILNSLKYDGDDLGFKAEMLKDLQMHKDAADNEFKKLSRDLLVEDQTQLGYDPIELLKSINAKLESQYQVVKQKRTAFGLKEHLLTKE